VNGMQTKYLYVLAALMLCGCGSEKNPYSSNGNYGQMDNRKEFGVVISQSMSNSPNVTGAAGLVGAAAGNAAGTAANNAATAATSGSILSPLTSMFSFGSSTPATPNSTVDSIHYVIRKDDGQQIVVDQVPTLDEQLMYPGQRVSIQWNGEYVRVYPADVENRFPNHQ